MSAVVLSAEQEAVAVELGEAISAVMVALEKLSGVELDIVDALQAIGIYEQLPPAIRLML